MEKSQFRSKNNNSFNKKKDVFKLGFALFLVFFVLGTLAGISHFGIAQQPSSDSNNSTSLNSSALAELNQSAPQDTAKPESIYLYLFYSKRCPHCHEEREFLDSIMEKYPRLMRYEFEVSKKENAELAKKFEDAFGVKIGGVPATFIGETYLEGFSSYTKRELLAFFENCSKNKCFDAIQKVFPNINHSVDFSEYLISNFDTAQPSPNYSNLTVEAFFDFSCNQCVEAQNFLRQKQKEYGFSLIEHNVNDNESKKRFEQLKNEYGLQVSGYPIVFINDVYLSGLSSIKKNFDNTLGSCYNEENTCSIDAITNTQIGESGHGAFTPLMPGSGDIKPEKTEKLNLPFFGYVDISNMSLFAATLIISFVDGFNPCSLWVLTFLLGIAIYSGSRKKIAIIGATYLFVTSTVYGLFMLGLVNVLSYVGYTRWIQLSVAIIAVVFGAINIKDFFWFKKGISLTISDKRKPGLFKRMREILKHSDSILFMIGATALLALGVTLVELPCTAGFPLIWSNLIAASEPPLIEFAFLFIIYLIIYLLDELGIFFGVLFTMQATKFEEKHGRVLKLIGGAIMVMLGLVMAFKPDLMDDIQGTLIVFGTTIFGSLLFIWFYNKVQKRRELGKKFKTRSLPDVEK